MGLWRRVSETLTIDVKPGWKKGTKITFPEKGDEVGQRSIEINFRIIRVTQIYV